MSPYEIFDSVDTNFEKLRTLNESDGDSENELLEVETDDYQGQGPLNRPTASHYLPVYPWLRIRRLLGRDAFILNFKFFTANALLTHWRRIKMSFEWNKSRIKLRLDKKLVFIRSGEI